MSSEEVSRPMVAFALSLVGGMISLIVGVWFFVLGLAIHPKYGAFIMQLGGYKIYQYQALGVGLWFLVAAVFVIVGSIMIDIRPEKHRKWGIITLVFSILGGGGVLGIIGGALAITWKPTPTPTPITSITRICPKCGHLLKEDAKFCPYCGNKLIA